MKTINPNTDVPGWKDNYFRCVVTFWEISYGWIDLLLTLALAANSFLGAFTLSRYNNKLDRKMILIISIVSGCCLSLKIFKLHAMRVIKERKAQLQVIVNEAV